MSEYGSAQIITEMGWRLQRTISRETLLRDLAYAADLSFSVHEWRGTDPEGRPLVVTWLLSPSGALMSAYAQQARLLDSESPLTRPVPHYSGEGAIYTPEYLRRREGNDRGTQPEYWRSAVPC